MPRERPEDQRRTPPVERETASSGHVEDPQISGEI